jgi:hypothetical protein
VITHRPALLRLADSAVLMAEGRIGVQGVPTDALDISACKLPPPERGLARVSSVVRIRDRSRSSIDFGGAGGRIARSMSNASPPSRRNGRKPPGRPLPNSDPNKLPESGRERGARISPDALFSSSIWLRGHATDYVERSSSREIRISRPAHCSLVWLPSARRTIADSASAMDGSCKKLSRGVEAG